MRRIGALVVLAALAAAPAALAKERNLSMIGAPVAPKAGKPWTATIKVTIDGRLVDGMGPMVRVISAAGKAIYVPSRATPAAGIYRARVVFPTAGMWRVLVVDRYSGRSYEFSRVRVRAA
jgi:hypothetical protein